MEVSLMILGQSAKLNNHQFVFKQIYHSYGRSSTSVCAKEWPDGVSTKEVSCTSPSVRDWGVTRNQMGC